MLNNKVALVTGADQGFGKEIARMLLSKGASICICSRNLRMLEAASDELKTGIILPEQRIIHTCADIGETQQIDRLYDFLLESFERLDIVVNNAGIQGPIGDITSNNWSDWEQALKINLCGTAYSMRSAIRIFRTQNSKGKIINISGGGATSSRPNFSSYAAAKTAVVRLTETLADEVKADRIYINAVAPGAMNTRLLDQMLDTGEDVLGKEEYQKLLRQKEKGGASIQRAAELVAYLSDEISDGITGKIISAVWDNWEYMHEKREEIINSNLYTLRRIV